MRRRRPTGLRLALPGVLLGLALMSVGVGLWSFADMVSHERPARREAAAVELPVRPEAAMAPGLAVVVRVVVPSLGIDLPVISGDVEVPDQGPDGYPPCDVALYMSAFEQPGAPGTTYLYAHARPGMFLPLLEASRRAEAAGLIGALVEVDTSDALRHVFRVTRVVRHVDDFDLVYDAPPGVQQLILQTSEGPRGTVGKLQVLATLEGVLRAGGTGVPGVARPRPCYTG